MFFFESQYWLLNKRFRKHFSRHIGKRKFKRRLQDHLQWSLQNKTSTSYHYTWQCELYRHNNDRWLHNPKRTSIIIYGRCTPVRRRLNGNSPLALVLIRLALRKSSQKTKRNCFHQIQKQRRDGFRPGHSQGSEGGRRSSGGRELRWWMVTGEWWRQGLSRRHQQSSTVVKFGPNLDLHCVG
jgi:hypothetical protein